MSVQVEVEWEDAMDPMLASMVFSTVHA